MRSAIDIAGFIYPILHLELPTCVACYESIGILSQILGDGYIGKHVDFALFRVIANIDCSVALFELFKVCVETIWIDSIIRTSENKLEEQFHRLRERLVEKGHKKHYQNS
jgi:hypothetical protein